MCACVHTCIDMLLYACIYVYIHAYIYICMHASIRMCVHKELESIGTDRPRTVPPRWGGLCPPTTPEEAEYVERFNKTMCLEFSFIQGAIHPAGADASCWNLSCFGCACIVSEPLVRMLRHGPCMNAPPYSPKPYLNNQGPVTVVQCGERWVTGSVPGMSESAFLAGTYLMPGLLSA